MGVETIFSLINLFSNHSFDSSNPLMRLVSSVLFLPLFSLVSAALEKKPNVVFILVDDLGFRNVNFTLGRPVDDGPSSTPNIDALAHEGLVFNRHYAYKTCTPSRSALQSGRLPIHVTEALRNPDDPNAAVPYNMTTLANIMNNNNYTSHFVGKSDFGMATDRHTPYGRGYSDRSLSYFSHKNEFFTHKTLQSGCKTKCETENAGDHECIMDLFEGQAPAHDHNTSEYVEFLFRDRALEIISDVDDDSSDPFFLFYSSHVAHCPLQVPESYRKKFDLDDDESQCRAQTTDVNPSYDGDFKCRSTYNAMINLLDDIVGDIVQKLKDKNVYDNTLIVFSSDNGGCVHLDESGGNNFPLRGGKYSDLEGGVRMAAFASGGWLERNNMAVANANGGVSTDETIHISDWLQTLNAVGGNLEDAVDELALTNNPPLPPFDSKNQLNVLLGTGPSAHRDSPLMLSGNAVLFNEWKLIKQEKVSPGGHPGQIYPNASSPASPIDAESLNLNCSNGCLFDVVGDLTEHHDRSHDEPQILSQLMAMLEAGAQTVYTNNDTLIMDDACADIDDATDCGCHLASHKWADSGGVPYFGPYARGQ